MNDETWVTIQSNPNKVTKYKTRGPRTEMTTGHKTHTAMLCKRGRWRQRSRKARRQIEGNE